MRDDDDDESGRLAHDFLGETSGGASITSHNVKKSGDIDSGNDDYAAWARSGK